MWQPHKGGEGQYFVTYWDELEYLHAFLVYGLTLSDNSQPTKHFVDSDIRSKSPSYP